MSVSPPKDGVTPPEVVPANPEVDPADPPPAPHVPPGDEDGELETRLDMPPIPLAPEDPPGDDADAEAAPRGGSMTPILIGGVLGFLLLGLLLWIAG